MFILYHFLRIMSNFFSQKAKKTLKVFICYSKLLYKESVIKCLEKF
nr:MAG TPA: hypothetical protein [Caudoviricetes sp.]